LAAAWGVVSTIALFAVLAHLVNVRLDVGPSALAKRIDFTRQVIETPVETTRKPKPERTEPPLTPGTTRIGIGRGHVDATPTWVRPIIDVGEHDQGPSAGIDRDIIPLVRVNPDYPPQALTRGLEGWVKVQFTVTAAGTVRDAFVVAADPRSIFDDAALRAIARWRYNPRVLNGVPAERVGMQTVIRFQLEDHL
jgi:protein TonB